MGVSACGHGGCGGLSEEFARRVELQLVYEELQELVEVPPSREVFLDEHRRLSLDAGRRLPYRAALHGIVERSAAL